MWLARVVVAAVLVGGATGGGGVWAQPRSGAAADRVATVRASIESSTELTDDERAAATRALDEAASAYRRAEEASGRAAAFREQAEGAPSLLETIRRELDGAAPVVQVSPEPSGSVSQHEQSLAQATADLRVARESLQAIEDEVNARRERRTRITNEIAALTQSLDDLREQAVPAGNGLVVDARRLEREAVEAAIVAQLEALRAEVASYEARVELLPARRDRAARKVVVAEETEKAWRQVVDEARRRQADAAARDASRLRREAAAQAQVLTEFARVSESLASARAASTGLPQRIVGVQADLARTRDELAALRVMYASAIRRLQASGLNRATGIVLRSHYEKLAEPSALRAELRETQERLEEAEILVVDRQEARLGASDIELTVQRLTEAASAEGVDASTPEFQAAARELAAARRDLLNQRTTDALTYFEQLLALEEQESTLLEATTRYREFIGERILWVKSITDRSGSGQDTALSVQGDDHSGVSLGEVWGQFVEHVASREVRSGAIGGLVLASFGLSFVAYRWLRRIGERVKSFRTDRLSLTFAALPLTCLAALPGPVVWWSLSRLGDGIEGSAVLAELAWAGDRLLPLVIPLAIALATLAKGGLAEMHFRWPVRSIRRLRRILRWFSPVFLVSIVVVLALDRGPFDELSAGVGRVAFTASQVLLSVFVFVVLHPKGVVSQEYLTRRASAIVQKCAPAAWWVGIAAPLLLAGLSWLGYHYTALELTQRLANSVGLALALVVFNAVLMRWLFVARRRVAVEDARRRRQQVAEAPETPGEDGPTEGSLPPIEEDKLDLPAISAQTTQLFRVAISLSLAIGLLGIWSDVLPALRVLDQVEVWPSVRVTEAVVDPEIDVLEGAAGAPAQGEVLSGAAVVDASVGDASEAGGARVVITLADILLAIAIATVSVIAFRNVPGLAEIFILQRLPLDAASRFALATVLRYAIGFAGILATAATLNMQWDKVQWLAAALTFGLGFGLQEIFANFVSGLIILAERPIRIGDTVTVGSVSGTVTKIRMRATTVTDWDRKELVIPNRTFITGEVINWTLSDPMARIIVPVGVAYGSDVALVERVLLEVGQQNSLVLKEPKHYVLFREFGESTLDFELRVFIAHIDSILIVQHQLRIAIDKSFREHGIEIAFPQRDLHVRSAEPLVELARQASASRASAGVPS